MYIRAVSNISNMKCDSSECNHKHGCSDKMKPEIIENFKNIFNNLKLPKKELIQSTPLINITKHILHGSVQGIPLNCQAAGGSLYYPKESKFFFHYQIRKTDNEHTVLDDTRKYGKVMEIYSGKEFQLDFWEHCLGTMLPGEVALFIVPSERLLSFPSVNKKLRDYMLNKKDTAVKHCCGLMSLQEQGGLGYPDLDQLMLKPESLEFIFDLLKVDVPSEVRKESWIMNHEEKLALVPILREEGNRLYVKGDFGEAICKYNEALGILEQLILREKPGEQEWLELDQSRVPFFTNLAQCQFKTKDYYAVIRNTSEALTRQPNTIKALYRRSKAYTETWDLDLAENDLRKIIQLSPDMKSKAENDLIVLERKRDNQELKERRQLAGKLLSCSSLDPKLSS